MKRRDEAEDLIEELVIHNDQLTTPREMRMCRDALVSAIMWGRKQDKLNREAQEREYKRWRGIKFL